MSQMPWLVATRLSGGDQTGRCRFDSRCCNARHEHCVQGVEESSTSDVAVASPPFQHRAVVEGEYHRRLLIGTQVSAEDSFYLPFSDDSRQQLCGLAVSPLDPLLGHFPSAREFD